MATYNLLNTVELKDYAIALSEYLSTKSIALASVLEGVTTGLSNILEDMMDQAELDVDPDDTQFQTWARRISSDINSALNSNHITNISYDKDTMIQYNVGSGATSYGIVVEYFDYLKGRQSTPGYYSDVTQGLQNQLVSAAANAKALYLKAKDNQSTSSAMITAFHTIMSNQFDVNNEKVATICEFIENRLVSSQTLEEYVNNMMRDEAPQGDSFYESAEYQFTGAHPIMAIAANIPGFVQGLAGYSIAFVWSFYSGLFSVFTSAAKWFANKFYNFITALTVDPACVSVKNSNGIYTFDSLFRHNGINSDYASNYPNLLSKLRKGPLKINLLTSENILSLDTEGNIVIDSKYKVIGNIKPILTAKLSGVNFGTNGIDPETCATIVNEASVSLNPASVSSSNGRMMMQSLYQGQLLESLIAQYIANMVGITNVGWYTHGGVSSFNDFASYYLSDSGTASNADYYALLVNDVFKAGTSSVEGYGVNLLNWRDCILPAIEKIITEQDVTTSSLYGLFFPFSAADVCFSPSKLILMTDRDVADAWKKKVATVAIVTAAVAVAGLATKKFLTLRKTYGAYADASYLKLVDNISKTGKVDQTLFNDWRKYARKAQLFGASTAIFKNAALGAGSSFSDNVDTKTIVRLIAG